MITIVIGTNRHHAKSKWVGNWVKELLESHQVESQFLDLADLPEDITVSALYEKSGKNEQLNALSAKMLQSEKFFFIVPEYNGSFPGVLKVFIDALPYPNPLAGKKASLIGISSGMQGGGLALSHLTDILHYLGVQVLAQKTKLAFIEKNLKGETLGNDLYQQLLTEQVDAFLNF
ncbi:MAG TPA: NADPH-dependent FMN reductase [Cytophagales bacterium]|nr:NADPH-dependent FMN reductase [Cytophagales bacterium]HAA23553.1 NADPH-dependent FMN reductase [Cytophagales bacterium]HAP59561.1 NADPH-dependent FMN reductase [Cytophagales bacterium]